MKFTNEEIAQLELCNHCESELQFFLRGEDKDAEDYRRWGYRSVGDFGLV